MNNNKKNTHQELLNIITKVIDNGSVSRQDKIELSKKIANIRNITKKTSPIYKILTNTVLEVIELTPHNKNNNLHPTMIYLNFLFPTYFICKCWCM